MTQWSEGRGYQEKKKRIEGERKRGGLVGVFLREGHTFPFMSPDHRFLLRGWGVDGRGWSLYSIPPHAKEARNRSGVNAMICVSFH